jgi:predicted esterase
VPVLVLALIAGQAYLTPHAQADTPPVVSAVAPAAGPLSGGTVVTLTGSGFTAATAVSFGGAAATPLTVVSDTELRVTSPATSAAGGVYVRVTTPAGTSPQTTAARFSYRAVPAISAITPASGPLAGGTVVTLSGTDLGGATGVTFSGTPGTKIYVVSAAEVRVTTPAGVAAGPVDVQVTTPGGTSAANSGVGFTYEAPPMTVSGISPTSGPVGGGTVVTLSGSNLDSATAVTFGGTPGTQLTVSASQVKVTAPPASAPGAVTVQVVGPDGTTPAGATGQFTYEAVVTPPAVTAVSPAVGPLAGGTVVTLTGTGLAQASQVTFGGTAGTSLNVVSDTELQVTSPARTTVGGVYVRVTTPAGTSPQATAARFTYRAAPTVSAISPSSGPVAGGTVVTITGTDLTGATAVTFGGIAGDGVSVLSATQVQATAPAAASVGSVDVQVTTPGGTSSPAAGARFDYQPATEAPIEHCGALSSNQTLGTDHVYLVTCSLLIPSGVSLTLTAGSVLKVADGASIQVDGALIAQGTADAPVTITGLRDDSAGGNTDGGGETDVAEAGDWGTVSVTSGGALRLQHAAVRFGSGVSAQDAAEVTVVDSELRSGVPLSVYRSGSAAGPVTVTGTTVADVRSMAASGISIDVRNDQDGIAPTVTGNIVTGVSRNGNGGVDGGRAITVAGPRLLPAQLAGNTGSGNSQNALFVSGTLAGDVALPVPGLPWVVDQSWPWSSLTVEPGATMSLNAGAVLKVHAGASIQVDGALVATGTAAAPATITSLLDDKVGGDTDGNGGASVPAAGDWGQLSVGTNARLELTRATVRYGSGVSSQDAAAITVVNSQLRHGVPLSVYRSSSASGPVTVSGSTVAAAGKVANGIYVEVRNDRDGIAPTVKDNVVSGVTRSSVSDVDGGRAITVMGPRLIPAQLSGNTGSGNGQNALFLSGSLAQSVTLPAPGLAWVVDRSWPFGVLTILPEVTLSLSAGAVLKLQPGSAIQVDGGLVAGGTPSAPVTITSLRDDSAGGNTDGYGTASTPAAGDWGTLYVGTDATLNLKQATVRYGSAISVDNAASVSVVDSQLRNGVPLSIYRSESYSGAVTVTGTTVAAVGKATSGISVDVRNDRSGVAPTVKDNVVSGAARSSAGDVDGGRAITVMGPRLVPSLLTGNTGSGNGQNALFISGSLAESVSLPAPGLPWVVDRSWPWSTLTIRPEATLTLNAGAVLKVARGATIQVDGGLVGSGTPEAPASLTSLRDDSVGGDTNNDGTNPGAAGDWGTLGVGTDATLSLTRTTVRFGSGIFVYNAAKASVVDSQLRNGVPLSIYRSESYTGPVTVTGTTVSAVGKVTSGISVEVRNDRDGVAPMVTNNVVSGVTRTSGTDVDGGRAITVAGPRLLPSMLTGNTGSSNSQNRIFVSGGLAQSVTLPAPGLLWVVDRTYYSGGLTVRPGATVTLAAGAVLKVVPGAVLYVDGRLVGSGTSTAAVTVTSLRDDSTGGDTNGDGSTTKPAAGDWDSVVAGTGATLDLTRTTVRYGSGVSASNAASVRVVDSQLRNGVPLYVYRSESYSGAVTVTGTTVAAVGNQASGITVDVRNDRDGVAPTVMNNVVSGVTRSGVEVDAGRAITVSGPRLLPAQLTGNTASGNGQNALFVSGSLAGDIALPAAGMTWVVDRYQWGGIDIRAGATVTVKAGAALKVVPGAGIQVEGSLLAPGTAAAPVTITSFLDDSVGGDTNGDKKATRPAVGDWYAIDVREGGVATLESTTLTYANTALIVANATAVTIHGKIVNAYVGVSGADTYVDATQVDWGSPSGPAPTGSGTSVQGNAVDFTPWVGYVAPTRPAVAAPAPDPVDPSCRDYLFIGVRGSGEDPQGDAWTLPTDERSFGSDVYDAYWGFKQDLGQRQPNATVRAYGLPYRALGVLWNPFGLGTQAYSDSIYDGVDKLIDQLYKEARTCKDEKVVLAGYSQGALVIHLTLQTVSSSLLGPDKLAAVILIADPAKVSRAQELTWEAANKVAGTGVSKASGVWDKTAVWADPSLGGPLPSGVSDRTLAICHNHDIVCAPGLISPALVGGVGGQIASSVAQHLSYAPEETNAMGAWAAAKAAG